MKIDRNKHHPFEFEYVSPIEADAKQVMEWRNDPETLKASFHLMPKVWPSFYREFLDTYFNFPLLAPLFVLYQGKRVAFLRFRPVGHPTGALRLCCDISINLAPSARHQGLGPLILQHIQPWLAERGYEDLYAEIKKENRSSQKAFLKAGFIQLVDQQKTVEDTGQTHAIARFIVELKESLAAAPPAVFILAEVGSNWRCGTLKKDLNCIKTLINAAVEAEADAIKFQVFRPETIYVKNAGSSAYLAESGLEKGMQELFTDLAMPYELIPEIAKLCADQQIAFMATAFSPADFAAIDPYVAKHKIASYELNHIQLLRCAIQAHKPLFLSTGASTEEEIAWAVEFYRQNGGQELTLLQCTAHYPAAYESLNLQVIPWLKQRFKTAVGFSDHSRDPLVAPLAAVALGAQVVEKHFTLNRNLAGPDHFFAINPKELKALVKGIRSVEKSLGQAVKMVQPEEEELRRFARRGIQAICPILRGDKLKEGKNIAILRPGLQPLGLHSKYLSEIEGQQATRALALGEGVQTGDYDRKGV